MSLAILTNFKDASVWKTALSAQLPNIPIKIYGEDVAALKAKFLVCWKPNNGQLKEFPNLEVIQSLGAGVDHIFDTNTLSSNLKVVRIVDSQLTVDMWEYCLTATLNYMKDFSKYIHQQKQEYTHPRIDLLISSQLVLLLKPTKSKKRKKSWINMFDPTIERTFVHASDNQTL